ncbi:MAG: phage tail tape measure protein [Ligilactobacillus acidipiscis]|jgi:TP901 family phage tail tape measure protein|nr:phage tail tape measure protein [Ligilactobacillus acidipiscis]MCI1953535.1 phage tail tape measure protein [Ligilactobacillus acidipiscis]
MESYSVQAKLSAVDNMSPTLKKAAAQVSSFGQKMGSSLQTVGKTSTALGLAVGAMTGKAIKSYGDFQESINKAAVIAGSSNKKLGSNMKDLEKVALSLGKTLPISAEDAGNAMIEMARNGASIKDLKKEFPSIAKAAAVSGEDLSATATTVQQAMNIWGGGAKNAAKDSATLAIVANKSNAEVGDMQQVFANVGTTAKNMGYSLKDVAIAAGVMTNAGIPAAQASMDLNHAFTQMVKPSKTAQGEMKKLGLSYTNAQGEMKPLKTIIKDVANATKGMSGAQKTAALNMLFGAAGAKAMAPLLDSVGDKAKKSGKGWDSFSSAIDKGAGSAKKANKYLNENSQNMTKNVGQSLAQMADAFDALAKTSIGSIAPQIRAVADALGDFATWLNNSKSPLAGFVKKLIALSPVIAGVLVVFGLLSMGLGKLISAFSAPAKALGGFSKGAQKAGKFAGASAGQIAAMGAKALGIGAGIGIAAAGLGVFAAGVAKLAETGKAGIIALAAMTASIVVLAATFAILQGPLTSAIPAMLSLSVVMLSAGAAALMVGAAIAAAGLGINLAGQGIMTLVQAFVLLGQNMQMIIPVMAAIGAGFAMMIVGFVTALATQIPLVAQSMLQMLLTIMQTINAYLPQLILAGTNIIVNLLNGIAQALPRIVEAATNVIVNFLNSLTQNVPRLIPAGVNFIVAVLKGIAQNIPTLAGAALNVVLKFLGWLTDNAGKIIAAGVKFVLAVVKGVGDHLGEIANAALDLLQKFLNTLLKSLNRIIDMGIKFVESVVEGIGKRVGQMPGEGLKLIKLFVRGVMKGLTGSRGAGKDNAGAVKDGVSGIDLFAQGSAIIGGFLKGLRSKFESVKSFVSGIAGWIKKHKGPISLDRKLLIPAGNAIMNGFNSGLVSQFGTVQSNIRSMTNSIAGMASNALNDNIQALNGRVSGSFSNSSTMRMDQSSLDRVTDRAVSRIVTAINNGHDIKLDGDKLVGYTRDRMDNALGQNVQFKARFS